MVTKLAATCDTGDAVEVVNSFEGIELPAMVEITAATVVVTIDANVLDDALVSATDGVVVGLLRINFTLLRRRQIDKYYYFVFRLN